MRWSKKFEGRAGQSAVQQQTSKMKSIPASKSEISSLMLKWQWDPRGRHPCESGNGLNRDVVRIITKMARTVTVQDCIDEQMNLRIVDPVFGNIWLNGVSKADFKSGKVKHQW